MNAFKRSEKPAHKLYSNRSTHKEFVTNKEFVSNLSVESVDFSQSFSELQNSFFSHESSKIDIDIIDQLKKFDVPASAQKSQSLIIQDDKPNAKRGKEEETNYTNKQVFGSVKLETDEFKRNWLCQSCIIVETENKKKSCEIF